MSIPVKQISRGPEYIMNFINFNMTKLNEIYKEGIETHTTGVLGFKCSKKENKMDVFFMSEPVICTYIQKDCWKQWQQNTPTGKKLFLVHDLDINSIFFITV